jgi:thymidylate synthase
MVNSEFIKNLKDSKWPQEFSEKLIVGSLESNVGIVTLWTQRDVVAKDLDPNSYSIIGQFYGKENGLEPLIRNCLANPNIRYILIVGNDMGRSKQVLINFFEKGVKDNKVIDTDTRISKKIPLEELNKLRENVKLIDLTSKMQTGLSYSGEYAKVISNAIKNLEKKEPYAKSKLFEKPKLDIGIFPSETSGYVVRGKYIGETWLKILDTLQNYGRITKLKLRDSINLKECIDVMAVISDEEPQDPKMESYFKFDKEHLFRYYNEICTAKIPAGTAYTYGSRFRAWKKSEEKTIDQVDYIATRLKDDPYSKQGVAITWEVPDNFLEGRMPCIVLAHAVLFENKLHLTSYIRSNDMYRGWILNAFGLRNFQKIIADKLNVKMGDLITISGSAHIYENNWEEIKENLKENYKGTNCFYDPRGYYIIELIKGQINVKHNSPDGQLLKEYNGKIAREINDKINSSQHTTDSYHSSYLGEELMKAEVALKLGIEYQQDKDLELEK